MEINAGSEAQVPKAIGTPYRLGVPRTRTLPGVPRPRHARRSAADATLPASSQQGLRGVSIGIAALILVFTLDDRHAGRVSDGRQMLRTAVAIAETGELGQARGAVRTVPRPEGDAVSRYGIGMSLAQLPAAFLAPGVEARFGPGSSRPLFLLAPLLGVLVAAAAAGKASRLLGASQRGQDVAILTTAIGSPLGSYAALDYSEPLQAATLALTFACALASRDIGPSETRAGAKALWFAAAAGFAAGIAVLFKSSLLAVVPFILLALPLWDRRALAALLGALPPLAAFFTFEYVRFKGPFLGYGGEGFTHPILDGLWRLLVGLNRGLLLFFPAALPAGFALAQALRRETGAEPASTARRAAFSILAATGSLLLMAASWWAWHGAGGWGPRLIVPAIPLLAAVAGLEASRWKGRSITLLLGASIALNIPPLLIHPAIVDSLVANCSPGATSTTAQELSRRLPRFAIDRGPDGAPRIPPDVALATTPAAAPHLVHAWLFWVCATADDSLAAQRLEAPPWAKSRPDVKLRLSPVPQELIRVFAPTPRWNYLGRGLREANVTAFDHGAYLEALADQIVRAHQTRRYERALRLSERLSRLSPDGFADALVVESYRLLGRPFDAAKIAEGLPRDRQSSPELLVVWALLARDRGDDVTARSALRAAAPYFPSTPVAAVASSALPLADWPRDLATMTARPEEESTPGLPAIGIGGAD